ncbi:hypothetical protein H5T51_07070 [Candidatus Bathyarchaeota archaeon]|nr:hypothetical protein [Candidatus Bathyarchaeota archaeon]
MMEMIHLTDEERGIIWNALAIAKDYHDDRGQKEKEKMACDLLTILTMVEKINFELKDGITEEGRKMLQEFMQNREKRRREESNVILFPKEKMIGAAQNNSK